jgi:hypothetical protein
MSAMSKTERTQWADMTDDEDDLICTQDKINDLVNSAMESDDVRVASLQLCKSVVATISKRTKSIGLSELWVVISDMINDQIHEPTQKPKPKPKPKPKQKQKPKPKPKPKQKDTISCWQTLPTQQTPPTQQTLPTQPIVVRYPRTHYSGVELVESNKEINLKRLREFIKG